MKLLFTREADFRQERQFGAKIGATLEFVGAHWRPLLKCLAYFVLPAALLMGVGMGLMMNQIWNQAAATMANHGANTPTDLNTGSFLGGTSLAMLGGLVMFLLLTSVVYSYLRLRLELAPEEVVTPALVWQLMRQRLGRVLLAWLLLAGLAVGGFGLIGGVLFTINSGLVALLILPVLYLTVPLSLYFLLLWLEDQGLMATLRRCFYLTHGKWWSTLGLLLVVGFIQGTVMVAFAIPQYAGLAGKMLRIPFLASDVFGLIGQCFYTVGIMISYTLPLIALAFQYFNLVERKEGVGLRLLIDSLGQAPTQVRNATYRPEDEGEY